jgi:hypothetical protein
LESSLTTLRDKRDKKLAEAPTGVPLIEGVSASTEQDEYGTTIAPEGVEYPDPDFGIDSSPQPGTNPSGGSPTPTPALKSDPWVTISASFSAEDQMSKTDTSSWGFSVGGGYGWGLFSVGGAYAHESSSR